MTTRLNNIVFKKPHHLFQSTTQTSSKYYTNLFKLPHHPLQSTRALSSKYHTTILKYHNHPPQRTTPPSSKYHNHVPQRTTPLSSKYHTTLYYSNYHITIFKVPHNPFQSTNNSVSTIVLCCICVWDSACNRFAYPIVALSCVSDAACCSRTPAKFISKVRQYCKTFAKRS